MSKFRFWDVKVTRDDGSSEEKLIESTTARLALAQVEESTRYVPDDHFRTLSDGECDLRWKGRFYRVRESPMEKRLEGLLAEVRFVRETLALATARERRHVLIPFDHSLDEDPVVHEERLVVPVDLPTVFTLDELLDAVALGCETLISYNPHCEEVLSTLHRTRELQRERENL